MVLDESYNVPSKLSEKATSSQKIAGLLAIICSIVAIILTTIFAHGSSISDNYLGGLNWNEFIFNWHPVLMVTGMLFCSLTAILSYRIFPMTKLVTKTMHVVLHSAAVICVCTGLAAVVIGNNYPSKNVDGVYYSNLCSLHSFIGLGALILYFQNYVFGFLHYIAPMALSLRKAYMPSHVFLGSFALFCSFAAALTGIMELTTEDKCGYNVTSPDYNPAKHYHELTGGCLTMNGAGVMILLTAFFAAFALWDNHTTTASATGVNRPLLNGDQDTKSMSFDHTK